MGDNYEADTEVNVKQQLSCKPGMVRHKREFKPGKHSSGTEAAEEGCRVMAIPHHVSSSAKIG